MDQLQENMNDWYTNYALIAIVSVGTLE